MNGLEGKQGFSFKQTKSSFGASQRYYFLVEEEGSVWLFDKEVVWW